MENKEDKNEEAKPMKKLRAEKVFHITQKARDTLKGLKEILEKDWGDEGDNSS